MISRGNFGYFGKLVAEERWSLARGGYNQMLDCITHCHNMNVSTHELTLRKKMFGRVTFRFGPFIFSLLCFRAGNNA